MPVILSRRKTSSLLARRALTTVLPCVLVLWAPPRPPHLHLLRLRPLREMMPALVLLLVVLLLVVLTMVHSACDVRGMVHVFD
jgi:hypothetical protein